MNTETTLCIPTDCLDHYPGGLLLVVAGQVRWANATLGRWLGLAPGRQRDPAALAPLAAGLLEAPHTRPGSATAPPLRGQRLDCRDPDDNPVTWLLLFPEDELARLRRERDELARKVEALTLTDELTGLANRRALEHTLGAQVTRSRRYHNPLTIALVQIRVPDHSTPYPDALVLGVSRFLRDRLRWADSIGRFTEDLFLLILPETGCEAAEGLLRDVRDAAARLDLPGIPPGDSPCLGLGIAEWQRGMDAARLVAIARQALGADAGGAATPD
jgi:diguanylate cyclase (GGDEF)-like protein